MLCLKSNILISDLYLIILYLDNLDIAPTAGKMGNICFICHRIVWILMYIFNLDSQQENMKQRGAPHWGLFRFQFIKRLLFFILCRCLMVIDKKVSGSDFVVALLMLCFCVSINFSRPERNLKRLSSMGSMLLMI